MASTDDRTATADRAFGRGAALRITAAAGSAGATGQARFTRTAGGPAAAEAGLAHLPVIASNVGGIPEVIKDGESGLLVPAGNANAIAQAIIKLYEDTHLRISLGEKLYEHVTHYFSKEKMVKQTLTLYGS